MTDRFTARLSEYLDGELTPGDAARVERHLADCVDCTEALDGLRAVVVRAGELDERHPAEDLWPGILERIDEEAPGTGVAPLVTRRSARPVARRGLSLSIPQLAAAAIALMTLSGGVVWSLSRPGSGETADRSTTVATAARTPTASGALTLLAADPAQETTAARYAAAIAELEQALFQGEAALDSSTVQKLRESLAKIDRAIDDARRALEEATSDPYLNQHLAETMRRKVRYMRQAAAMLTAQS